MPFVSQSSVPAAPPENVQAFVISSTEILVSWSEVPELDQNGVIINYEVQLEPLDFPANISVDLVNTTSLQERSTDLEEFVSYSIIVRAYTSVGPGPYSNPVTERTSEDGNVHILFTLYFWSLNIHFSILSTSCTSSECPSHSHLLH